MADRTLWGIFSIDTDEAVAENGKVGDEGEGGPALFDTAQLAMEWAVKHLGEEAGKDYAVREA